MPEQKNINWISGFWRRIGAICIDSTVLGLVGVGLSFVFPDQFVELGALGRFVGFFIALAYFGAMNSKICGGQTLGKKMLKLKVVNADNQAIGILRSCARQCILGIPVFLNGAQFSNKVLFSYWMLPFSVIVFGGLLSIVYLYVFNRVSRQSLHDLIVGTFVVNADVEKQVVGAVWKPHLIVVGVFFIVAAVIPIFTSRLTQDEPFKEILSTQVAMMGNPAVNYATVSVGESWFSSSKSGAKTTTYVSAQVSLKKDAVSDSVMAKQLAKIIVASYPGARQKDVIQINLVYGFDIGIAYRWRNYVYAFDPKELTGSD